MSETMQRIPRTGSSPAQSIDRTRGWDVLVLGAGGSGLAAAASAAQEGRSVLVLESEEAIGGSTRCSAGMLTASATSLQAQLGVEDAPERMFQHYMDLNQWKVLPGPVWEFCHRSGEMVEWLLQMGLDIPVQKSRNAHEPGLARAGVEDVWRGHVPSGRGQALVDVLSAQCQQRGVEFRLNCRVDSLAIDNGAVAGVRIGNEFVASQSVVVATGGFAQDPELRAELLPDSLAAGDALFVVAGKGSRGDHVRFARESGLSLFGHGWGLLLLTSQFQRFHHWESGFPPPSRVYVDAQGKRCMDEDSPYAVSQGIWKERGGVVWCVFDERARQQLPEGCADWTPERILEEVDKGVVATAPSLDELARSVELPEAALARSVTRWNELMTAGYDEDFRRHETLRAKGATEALDPIAEGPYYAVKMIPGELVCTHTGLQIDSQARVLDAHGTPVENLFAAGEAAGGVLGQRYVGGGNSVTNAMVLGRLAGQSAAKATAHA